MTPNRDRSAPPIHPVRGARAPVRAQGTTVRLFTPVAPVRLPSRSFGLVRRGANRYLGLGPRPVPTPALSCAPDRRGRGSLTLMPERRRGEFDERSSTGVGALPCPDIECLPRVHSVRREAKRPIPIALQIGRFRGPAEPHPGIVPLIGTIQPSNANWGHTVSR